MTAIKRKYWGFYLLGREERRLRNEIDPAVVARGILDEEEASLAQAVTTACEGAAASISARVKKNWLADHETEIRESGVDAEEAYRSWIAGRVDELAVAIESDVAAALVDIVFEEEA